MTSAAARGETRSPGRSPGASRSHVLDTREELLNGLTEAAELEHGLLVQYLFAAFSLKMAPAEGLNDWALVEMVREWKGQLLRVAREEMAHLGTVCNLLSALGGAPHFRRPNFPQPSRYYPQPRKPGEASDRVHFVPFTLERFTRGCLDRFIRFETPEPDEAAFIAPDPIEYTTVGDLYQQIRNGIETVAEDRLFLGPREIQDDNDWTARLRLLRVVDRRSALEAIDSIIVEGEGSPADRPTSHHSTFLRIRAEWDRALERDPSFDPARAVVNNPMTREFSDVLPGTILNVSATRDLAELASSLYVTSLMMLLQFYTFAGEPAPLRAALQAAARQLMSGLIRPLGEMLTELPARDDAPGARAGLGFEIYGDIRLPHRYPIAWRVMLERLSDQADACGVLANRPAASGRLGFVAENLRRLTSNLEFALRASEA